MKFDRTDEGFAKAYDAAKGLANMHGKSYAVAVFAEQPDHYTLSLASLIDAHTKLATGTQVLPVNPD